MKYLELKQEVKRLQEQLRNEQPTQGERVESGPRAAELRVTVISDMPLQPWFELYLQKFWAKQGRIIRLRRVLWQQRHEVLLQENEQLVYWPSTAVAQEIDPETDKAGIWISNENGSDPLTLFYCQTKTQQVSAQYPAGSTIIDLEKLMLRLGLAESLADKESRWGDQYSQLLQQEAAREIVRVYETKYGRRKKCLVLDCDGVLWGGIISEDGMDGISLGETGKGRLYQEFQTMAGKLKDHGIILAICSKNDEADVKAVFDDHTAMKLQKEDIAAWSVNWQPKSKQMMNLAEMLQIDLQDMVLVDDSRWEIEEVRASYPQVAGVLFDPSKGLYDICKELAAFFLLQPEDQNQQNRLRVQTYADNVKRQVLRRETGSYDAFLEKLQTKVIIQEAAEADLPRISDLSRRANQCTNGIRYTVDELKRLQEQGGKLQAVFVSDIYRDLGLVGCIAWNAQKNVLDLFCLSCRALGRRVEQQLFAAVPQEITKLRWQDTGKNANLKEQMENEGRWQIEA